MLVLVTAILKPHKLEDVMSALKTMGVKGASLTEIRGFGRQGGHVATYRGAEYEIDFLPKLKLEIVVPYADADDVVNVIIAAGRTGKIGDGKIWVTKVEELARIRTGDRGDDAL